MSHIVKIQTKVHDPVAIQAACERLKLKPAVHGRYQLFSDQATGYGVQLPGWKYPVVCDTETGQLQYDNYQGHWGDQAHADRFLQAYAVEMARLEARRKGHSVTEQQLANGSIKLTIQVGGGA